MSQNVSCAWFHKRAGSVFLALVLVLSLAFIGGCNSSEVSETESLESTPPAVETPESPEDQTTEPADTADNTQALPYTFTDVLGNEVTVESTDRVVATMGSFAGIWELAGGQLVGAPADGFDSYGIDENTVASIGDFKEPNLEQIIALEPDLVILTAASTGHAGAANQVSMRETLEASGITTAYFEVTTFEDYLAMLKTCTEMLGTPENYEKYGASVENKIQDIKASVLSGEKPSAIIMTTFSGGTRVGTSQSQAGTMLAELGAENVVEADRSLLQDFSFEKVIELNPEHVFVIPMGNDPEAAERNFKDQTSQNPAWSTLDAVKEDNVHVLDHNLFLFKPNEKWGEAYQILFDALYSEGSAS